MICGVLVRKDINGATRQERPKQRQKISMLRLCWIKCLRGRGWVCGRGAQRGSITRPRGQRRAVGAE